MKKMLITMAVLAIAGLSYAASGRVWNPQALGSVNDLTVPTAVQNYPLGSMVRIWDASKKSISIYMYAKADIALSAYNAYSIINSTGGNKGEWFATTPVANTVATTRYTGIAPADCTTQYYAWLQIEGKCTAAYVGSSTVGYAAAVTGGATTLQDLGAVTLSSTTVGLCNVTHSGAGNVSVTLLGVKSFTQ